MVIATFAFLVVLLLWVVGARNRLTRLRQDMAQAFSPMELQLRKRHAVARHLAEQALQQGAVPREVAESVRACATQAALTLQGASDSRNRPDALRRLGTAEELLAAALPALMQATEGHAEPHLADLHHRLAQIHAPLDYARMAYNATVQTHNAALRVFPTTLVATTFRFPPGVQMPRLSTPT